MWSSHPILLAPCNRCASPPPLRRRRHQLWLRRRYSCKQLRPKLRPIPRVQNPVQSLHLPCRAGAAWLYDRVHGDLCGAHGGSKHNLPHFPRGYLCAHAEAIERFTDLIADDGIADRSTDRGTNGAPHHCCPNRTPNGVSDVNTDHARAHPRRGDLCPHARTNPLALDVGTNDKHANRRADIEPPNHVRPDRVPHRIPDFVAIDVPVIFPDRVANADTNRDAHGQPDLRCPNPRPDQVPDVGAKHARAHSIRRDIFSNLGAHPLSLDLDADSIADCVPHLDADDKLTDERAYWGTVQQPDDVPDCVAVDVPVIFPDRVANADTNRDAHGQPDLRCPDPRPDQVPDVGAKHARAHSIRRDIFSDLGANSLVVSNCIPDHGADDVGADGVPGARPRDRVQQPHRLHQRVVSGAARSGRLSQRLLLLLLESTPTVSPLRGRFRPLPGLCRQPFHLVGRNLLS